ncbi:cell filamentation protein fic [Klebsiella variicola]|uniref:Cell filamentation protein fic n=1 Tax=Klebsiella variicola TaxID=244366 RepID=A0A7H4M8T4_KLEVA|nr:cell filamentation protein fic [Klebsiella variicola]
MSDKFGDERDPYLYPALNVLRNRLGIRQAKNLQQAAFEMTALRAATLPLGRGCAAYPIYARFIISCIRICLTGPAGCVK